METSYIIGLDQSTQGTKVVLLDQTGLFVAKYALAHRQIIHKNGWVEHDPMEIYHNVCESIRKIIEDNQVSPKLIRGIGIANQRETIVAWNKKTGQPLYNAIVWQCNRAIDICEQLEERGYSDYIREKTGLKLSPFFSAAKMNWIISNVPEARELLFKDELYCGTMDSWIIYCLTNKKEFKTDASNASRTQLFNLHTMKWDEKLCELFEIKSSMLPQICDSNDYFGETDVGNLFPSAVPIHAVLGDSHASFFAQSGIEVGSMIVGYGTGSCVLMNIGEKPTISTFGVSTSVGWKIDGKTNYVFDGVINYSGAVVTWLIENMKLISSPDESEPLCYIADENDKTYLIPAFTGIGCPYWRSDLSAAFIGMNRKTGRAELVRAAIESIAFQINDVIQAMNLSSEVKREQLMVSGSPTKNNYLMQFQSDLLKQPLCVPEHEELSAIGAAILAGLTLQMYNRSRIRDSIQYRKIVPRANNKESITQKLEGWESALNHMLKMS